MIWFSTVNPLDCTFGVAAPVDRVGQGGQAYDLILITSFLQAFQI